MIRVLIGDDDASFREALRDLLDADSRFQVVGTAADGHALLGLAESVEAETVLLDVRMPAGGVSAAAALCDGNARWAPVTVVAISADTSVSTVVAMLRAGVAGYLAKGGLGVHLPDLVARCVDGERVLAVPGADEALRQSVEPRA